MGKQSDYVGGQSLTPPHHPTYGVGISRNGIETIISEALPGMKVVTVERLASGKSFNNRLYFISLSSVSTQFDTITDEVVLKLPGWNFGIDKIQNEVISLLLVERYCPQIPVPRIMAWSEGGTTIQRVERENGLGGSDLAVHIAGCKATTPHPMGNSGAWILMTRLSGQLLQPDLLETQDMHKIVAQLAEYMSQWRTIPSPAPQIGCLRFIGPSRGLLAPWSNESAALYGLDIAVHGLLIGTASSSIDSSQAYYTVKLTSELDILKVNENYTQNRASVIPLIEDLLFNILPNAVIFQNGQNDQPISVFTHYDLSPRNVLVERTTAGDINITGIVDFEFSGFFPAEGEFTNTSINGEGDWPILIWESFLTSLSSRGVKIPKGKLWDQACALVRITENIAPWQFRAGGVKGQALETALREARSRVETNIQFLR